MAVEFFFLEAHKFALEICYGEFGFEDVIASREHPQFRAFADHWAGELRYMTVNFEDLKVDISERDILSMSELEPILHPDCKRVFVTPGDLAFGNARQFAAHREKQSANLGVVRGISEGLAFLDLPLEIGDEFIEPILSDHRSKR